MEPRRLLVQIFPHLLVHTLSDPVRGRRLVEVRCDRADRPGVTAAIAEAVAATFEAAPECHPDDLALTEEES